MVEELLRKGFREEFERLRKIDKKEAIKEGIKQGKKEEIEQGRKEGIKIAQRELGRQWLVKMIQNNVSEQKILEITKISKKELKEIRNKIQMKTS